MNCADADLFEGASRFENLPVEEWPNIQFKWDISKASQRFSLDGCTKENFEQYYPQGLLLGWVSLSDFDAKLCHYSRRDTAQELWACGCQWKLSRMIEYLAQGRPISPPLVKPTMNSSEIIFLGGNHRYAVAKALNINNIPILVSPQHAESLSCLCVISWETI